MRRLRCIKVRGISEVMGKGFAYAMFGVTWLLGWVTSKIVGKINQGRYEDDFDSKPKRFVYKNVANKVFDVSYAVSEFIFRCVLWFVVNVIGMMILGVIIYGIGMIVLLIASLFVGGRSNTVVEEYYYYY